MVTKEAIREFIMIDILQLDDREKNNFVLKNDESLIDNRLLNSIGLTKLILFIEKHVGSYLGEEPDFSNFETIDNIYNFLSKNQTERILENK
jgi:acyl carrier protein